MDKEKIKISKAAALKNAGFTQESLAKELGVSKKTVSSWVNKPIRNLATFIGFCTVCNISVDSVEN